MTNHPEPRQPTVVVLGQLSIDDVVLADGTTAMASCGGDATYAALAASLWTRPVGVAAPAGSDFPAEHLAAIAAHGLDLGGVRSVPGPSIRYWVLYEADGRRTFVQRSPESAFVDTSPAWVDLPERFWAARTFHLAAMPLDAVEGLVAELRKRVAGVPITLDTHEDEVAGYQDRLRALMPAVAGFLPSREEVASWFGWDDPERAIVELGAMGQRFTIVKMGAAGSLVHEAATGKLTRVGLAPGPVVDVTGAGDAFCGSVAAGLSLGDAPAEAARRGAAGASLAIGGFGALHDWIRPDEAERRRLATQIEAAQPREPR